MEDDDKQFASNLEEEDYGFDDSSDESTEEIIDYEGMKHALELFQQSDIAKEALENGVDLVEYEQRIETDLTAASKASVDDYIANSKHLAKLHKEIDLCDNLLEQIQEMLHTYQGDLSGVANEIRNLQNDSLAISQKLENRRTMDGMLRGFINKVAINPNMVKVLVEVVAVCGLESRVMWTRSTSLRCTNSTPSWSSCRRMWRTYPSFVPSTVGGSSRDHVAGEGGERGAQRPQRAEGAVWVARS